MELAVLCSGQGGQNREMFDILEASPAARHVLEQASDFLGWDVLAAVRNFPEPSLFENRIAQPLICTAAIATWTALARDVPRPVTFLGYSVGELAAYGCVGSLSLRQTLYLAQRRAALMDSIGTGSSGLLALRGLGRGTVETLCNEHKGEIAIINGPDHFVVGGEKGNLEQLQAAALKKGATVARQLRVAVAAHTSMLAGVADKFVEELVASDFKDPDIPVLAGVSAQAVYDRNMAISTLAAQLHSPIDWSSCMHSAIERGARLFIEIGPGNALSSMVRDAYPGVSARSVSEFRSLQGMQNWVSDQLA